MANDDQAWKAVVSGTEHLRRLVGGASAAQVASAETLSESEEDCAMIGTAMSALIQAATCHRGCNQGPHIFEAMCGRAYNLGCSAYLLALSGLYDEAGNLIRSIGEIANLVSLSAWDKELFQRWLTSDDKTRKRDFGPVKVRIALAAKGAPLIADEEWYSRFCDKYIHVTPVTVPGMHNNSHKGWAGPIYQREGLTSTLGELATVIGSLSLLVCKFFRFDDLYGEIIGLLNRAKSGTVQ